MAVAVAVAVSVASSLFAEPTSPPSSSITPLPSPRSAHACPLSPRIDSFQCYHSLSSTLPLLCEPSPIHQQTHSLFCRCSFSLSFTHSITPPVCLYLICTVLCPQSLCVG
jgi:hypothetical protein